MLFRFGVIGCAFLWFGTLAGCSSVRQCHVPLDGSFKATHRLQIEPVFVNLSLGDLAGDRLRIGFRIKEGQELAFSFEQRFRPYVVTETGEKSYVEDPIRYPNGQLFHDRERIYRIRPPRAKSRNSTDEGFVIRADFFGNSRVDWETVKSVDLVWPDPMSMGQSEWRWKNITVPYCPAK